MLGHAANISSNIRKCWAAINCLYQTLWTIYLLNLGAEGGGEKNLILILSRNIREQREIMPRKHYYFTKYNIVNTVWNRNLTVSKDVFGVRPTQTRMIGTGSEWRIKKRKWASAKDVQGGSIWRACWPWRELWHLAPRVDSTVLEQAYCHREDKSKC